MPIFSSQVESSKIYGRQKSHENGAYLAALNKTVLQRCNQILSVLLLSETGWL